MRRGDADPYGDVADGQMSDAMHTDRLLKAAFFAGVFEDAVAFDERPLFVGFVFKRRDLMPLVMILHPPFERNKRPAGRVFGGVFEMLCIQRTGRKRKYLSSCNRQNEYHMISVVQRC